MIERLYRKYGHLFVPRWVILTSDLLLTMAMFVSAYMLRFNFDISAAQVDFTLYQLPYIFAIYLFSFLVTRSYVGVIRYFTQPDLIRLLIGVMLGCFINAVGTFLAQHFTVHHALNVPFSVVLIHFFLTSFVLVNSRILLRLSLEHNNPSRQKIMRVLIFGAGELGILTKQVLRQPLGEAYKIIGFVDDKVGLQNKRIDGLQVYSSKRALSLEFIEKQGVEALIIAVNKLNPIRKREIVDICLERNIATKVLPPVSDWVNNSLLANQIHDVRIEDLLGRDEIHLDETVVRNGIRSQTILITGAAGSIGSEIVRQVLKYNPKELVLIDQAETPMHDLSLELSAIGFECELHLVVCDVNNQNKLRQIFEIYRPSMLFHAAAYKHVPLMESNPYEAARVNIGGTKTLADLAIEFGVERFVMISTDKAVNPTNVMGATKRIAELYTRSLFLKYAKTQFIATRFGNVLGSNGSVIPLFKKQIERGGPVTVTHEEITRYFMTIPEACLLVLEAAFMGNAGEIFVFDMGASVKIIDLARKMIKLSGFEPDKDIEIKVTGLRPGEKLYEELLAQEEISAKTHNPKIMIGAVDDGDFEEVISAVNQLVSQVDEMSEMEIVKAMKKIVPEFKSNNSIFVQLD